jgi:hypothetical protein
MAVAVAVVAFAVVVPMGARLVTIVAHVHPSPLTILAEFSVNGAVTVTDGLIDGSGTKNIRTPKNALQVLTQRYWLSRQQLTIWLEVTYNLLSRLQLLLRSQPIHRIPLKAVPP